MAFSIKNDEADRLARELAEATGESLTDAVIISLRERLERMRHERADYERRLMAAVEDLNSLPVADSRLADDIIGYDENGLPT